MIELWTCCLNTELALTKMLHWFVPYLSVDVPVLTRPFIVLGGGALGLALINRKSHGNWLVWFRVCGSIHIPDYDLCLCLFLGGGIDGSSPAIIGTYIQIVTM